MNIHRAIAAVAALGLLCGITPGQGAELKLLQGNALNAVMEELGPQFEKATESKLAITLGTSAQLKARIASGEAFDVVLLTKAALDELATQGKIADSPRAAIARSGIGVAIRRGAAKPDLGTVEAFKRAMLDAKSIGYVDQTPTAAALKVVFAKLGIADEIKSKIKELSKQAAVAVSNGDVELGLTQISEILPYPGVELVGPLPADIQNYTTFSAGISATAKNAEAAAALIKFLTTPDAKAVIKAKGMEPG
ncbi:MAG TPA: substrate-binding domain-containing protein [Xanthobacteraceae bacterium]|jgi:molybdate transport system substrate-binding protein|nr:substrate-binding domain-containing protein [Xanthobacteraceae bacterium]